MNMPSKIMETELGSKDSQDKRKLNDPESKHNTKMEASFMDRIITDPRMGSPSIKVSLNQVKLIKSQ